MIRLVLAVLFVFLFLVISSPLMAFEWFYMKRNYKKASLQSLRIVQWAFRCVMFFSGTSYEIHGKENIPKNQAVLFVANHRSFFDVVLVYSQLPYLTGFVAKDGLLKVPLLRVWMRRLHCLFLKRDDPRAGMQMILDGIEMIKNGVSVFIFPEGTRNAGDELLDFKAGAVKMASKTDCPIIPIAITGTREILENQFPRIKRSHATVTFGKPIIPSQLDEENRKHLAAYSQSVISEMLKK